MPDQRLIVPIGVGTSCRITPVPALGRQNQTAINIPGRIKILLWINSPARAPLYHFFKEGREVSIMRIQHWQDAASLLLGVWLVVSPFVLGFAGADVWITIVLGLCVIVAAVEGFVLPSYLEEWAEILFGLALVMAPWTVGYESVSATVSSAVSGILVILLAIWELQTDRDFTTWWRDRWHHRAS
jgi:SPW repeat